ncbi:uncharacterized protein LOC103187147 [Callorhinchus milii]|uniref:uncharacterized protein LOC103187147 n=1 Tax=Callorhinchus milii TaxID=7868 RepID=UPI0004575EF9|nr:uncharacterized protein LOC103187147 [Callorhinchus milii]|eukprot:gi/632976291/ref/XP_007904714.1/ PREDICTED: uncharacterized protein LOC103187147 [Callorhinchus milii]
MNMAASTLLKVLLGLFLLCFSKSQDNSSSQTDTSDEAGVLTTLYTSIAQNYSESSLGGERNASLTTSETTTKLFSKTQQAVTQTPLHTYLLSQSKVPKTPGSTEGTNRVNVEVYKASNNRNEILVSDDEHLTSEKESAAPTLGNTLEDTAGEIPTLDSFTVHATPIGDGLTPGIKGWKVAVISAATFLALEALALAVYCTKCRKRSRKATPAKICEDSEAAETINAESNENTVTGNETTHPQVNHPQEFPESQTSVEVEKAIAQEPADLDTSYEGKLFMPQISNF